MIDKKFNHLYFIGVTQLLNKKGAHSFDENDEAMFEVKIFRSKNYFAFLYLQVEYQLKYLLYCRVLQYFVDWEFIIPKCTKKLHLCWQDKN